MQRDNEMDTVSCINTLENEKKTSGGVCVMTGVSIVTLKTRFCSTGLI